MGCRMKQEKQRTGECGRFFQAKRRTPGTPNFLLPTVKLSSKSCAKPRRVCRITSSQSRTDPPFPNFTRFILDVAGLPDICRASNSNTFDSLRRHLIQHLFDANAG